MAKGILLGEIGRRDVLRAGLIGLGGSITGFGAGPVNEAAAATPMGAGSRVLVVVELSGANDGLNTIIPYTNDAYYRARPKLRLRRNPRYKPARFGRARRTASRHSPITPAARSRPCSKCARSTP